jgi:hypothetical protein
MATNNVLFCTKPSQVGNKAPCYVVKMNNIKTRTQQDVSTKTSKKEISNYFSMLQPL